MSVSVSAFRWLDILEKEFDKAFVDLDLLFGEIDQDQSDITDEGRAKMTVLSSCFAQLTHKAQTIAQSNAKLEVNFFFVIFLFIISLKLGSITRCSSRNC
jgi:hypothetical protein